jgi:hypothetical protein
MSQVSANPPRTPSPQRAHPPGRPPAPADVEAMRTAMAGAKNEKTGAMPLPGRGKPQGKGAAVPMQAQAEASPAMLRAMALNDGKGPVGERDQGDAQQDGQGFGAPAGAMPPVAVQAAAVPPPTVDPTAFAQLMSQLWSKEHGKGAKEVRVQLGASAWPATGARLVRNAAGELDIAIEFGSAAAQDEAALATLRERFADEGVVVGALTFED